MISRFLTCLAAATLFVLAIPVRFAAQDNRDTGTFGGPMSFLNLPFNGVPALSEHRRSNMKSRKLICVAALTLFAFVPTALISANTWYLWM
jgi:hypothetical protein